MNLSHRAIERSIGMSYGSVVNYLQRAKAAGVSWPLPADMDERTLGRLLFPSQDNNGPRRFVEPDFDDIHDQLKDTKGVTKQLLWQEYRERFPDNGYSYSQFCHHYRTWRDKQQRSMRQTHRAGEKLFVDYCGPTMPIVNPDTGEIRTAQIFVAVLGASNYTFSLATWTQKQADWIHAHIKAFEFFGGTPQIVVPDQLKSAVKKSRRYNPDINFSYQQMASYYQTAIIPARPYKPKDKAKAEVAVQIVERWIMARLRHHTFFTLASLNLAIRDLLTDLNQRPFKALPGSRLSQFNQIDKPVLNPLPAQPYEYVEIKAARVHIDYHIEYEKHYYSVPHHLVKEQVDVHASTTMVNIFAYGQRVASHVRSFHAGGHTTLQEHMPHHHRAMSEWSSERFLKWAGDIGPDVQQLVDHLLHRKKHEEQNYRTVLGLLSLSKQYGRDRLDKACHKAIALKSYSPTSVKSILKNGLDRIPDEAPEQDDLFLDDHENLRGGSYYH
jgi:transposase